MSMEVISPRDRNLDTAYNLFDRRGPLSAILPPNNSAMRNSLELKSGLQRQTSGSRKRFLVDSLKIIVEGSDEVNVHGSSRGRKSPRWARSSSPQDPHFFLPWSVSPTPSGNYHPLPGFAIADDADSPKNFSGNTSLKPSGSPMGIRKPPKLDCDHLNLKTSAQMESENLPPGFFNFPPSPDPENPKNNNIGAPPGFDYRSMLEVKLSSSNDIWSTSKVPLPPLPPDLMDPLDDPLFVQQLLDGQRRDAATTNNDNGFVLKRALESIDINNIEPNDFPAQSVPGLGRNFFHHHENTQLNTRDTLESDDTSAKRNAQPSNHIRNNSFPGFTNSNGTYNPPRSNHHHHNGYHSNPERVDNVVPSQPKGDNSPIGTPPRKLSAGHARSSSEGSSAHEFNPNAKEFTPSPKITPADKKYQPDSPLLAGPLKNSPLFTTNSLPREVFPPLDAISGLIESNTNKPKAKFHQRSNSSNYKKHACDAEKKRDRARSWSGSGSNKMRPEGAPRKDRKEKEAKRKLCRHFLKGFCKQGNKCNFLHDPSIFCPDSQKVFLGGLPNNMTAETLVKELEKIGYKVLNKPTILRGFTPQVCLNSAEAASRLVSLKKIRVGNANVDVRPYEDKHPDSEQRRSVFLGGLPADASAVDIRTSLNEQGYKVVNHPIIKTGFTPQVVLETVEQAQDLVRAKRATVKGKKVDVRPYVNFRKRYS